MMKVPNKPAAAGVTGELAVVLVWTAEQFGVQMPSHVGAAFAVLLASIAYYLVPSRE
jgi:hypothetical protein